MQDVFRLPVAGIQHIAACVGAAPCVEGLVRHREPLHCGHLGAAVRHDDQPLLAVGKCLVHQSGKRRADAVTEIALPLPVRVSAGFVLPDPLQILRVLLHTDELLPLEPAEIHLLQPLHRHQFCIRKEDLCRLRRALQRRHIDDLRGKVRPPQLGRAFGRKRDVPLALIPFLGVVFRSAMAQQIDPHGVVSFFHPFAAPL